MLGRHEAAAVVFLFRPGIGIEQEGLVDGARGQNIHQVAGIARMHADTGRARLADLAQKHRDAVDIGLGPDDPDPGVRDRLVDHVFTAAEADLQPDRAFAEKRVEVEGRAVGVFVPVDTLKPDLLEIPEIGFLAVAQALAADTAVEVAPGRAGGGFAFHGRGSDKSRREGQALPNHDGTA